MRLTILALGSRGDVQPFAALGAALQRRGHAVRIAAAEDYAGLVTEAGLEFAAVGGLIRQQMDFELARQALEASRRALPLGFARRFVQHVEPLVERIVADCAAAAQGAELLLASTLGLLPGRLLAETLGLPLAAAHMHPASPTRAFPDVNFPELPGWLPLRGRYNRLTHQLAAGGMAQLLHRPLERSRRTLFGRPPRSRRAAWQAAAAPPGLTLYAYSRHLAGPPPGDWERSTTVTGFWFNPAAPGWAPPAGLARFLEDGPPPAYIGFGSILAGEQPERLTALLVEALQQAGLRGVLHRGWGDLGRLPGGAALPESILSVDSAPHDWLFPRCTAVVTHGGAGTVAAALQAARPTLVTPVFGDQFTWGRRVQTLGAGPAPIPRRNIEAARLSAAGLAAVLRQTVENPHYRRRAAEISRLLQAEDGPGQAADLLEAYHARFKNKIEIR